MTKGKKLLTLRLGEGHGIAVEWSKATGGGVASGLQIGEVLRIVWDELSCLEEGEWTLQDAARSLVQHFIAPALEDMSRSGELEASRVLKVKAPDGAEWEVEL